MTGYLRTVQQAIENLKLQGVKLQGVKFILNIQTW